MGIHGTRRQFLTSVGAAAAAIQTFEHIGPYGVLAADTANLKEVVRPFYTDCLTVNTRADVAATMASGSPKGEFMGLNLDGSKSFEIMTIDIHTIEGQQIKQVYHLEEWPTAIKQLKG